MSDNNVIFSYNYLTNVNMNLMIDKYEDYKSITIVENNYKRNIGSMPDKMASLYANLMARNIGTFSRPERDVVWVSEYILIISGQDVIGESIECAEFVNSFERYRVKS